ncbi:Spermatogenesis-associated protein 20 [Exophiala dermatitidis]
MVHDEPELVLHNALANSPSPYLRAHEDNPVAWQEWSEDTIFLAKSYQRLIFLSIGYNACHWCHVMERESFSSPEVASFLNKHFIPIKVDRECRPDLDDIYMNYVTATTGSGGWPLNVFLTPDLRPVFGGTYWPGPSSTTNLHRKASHDEAAPSFLDILRKMQEVWSTQRERCRRSSTDITTQLRAFAAEGIHSQSNGSVRDGGSSGSEEPEPLELDLLDDALNHFIARYDPTNGGFGASTNGQKFPTPSNLTILLRIGAAIAQPSTHTRFGFFTPVLGILGEDSCLKAASMALHTLKAMSRSGLRDQLGYGFHRYSVTPDWNLPHFEKMMCDNAQLLGCYCDAWALGRDPEILGTIYNLVEYFTNPESPIVRPGGGWYASEDADSRPSRTGNGRGTETAHNEKKEGAFYVWTYKELESLLGEQDAPIIARHFGVKPHGNVPAQHDIHDEFLSQNVLHVDATPSTLAKEFGIAEDEVVRIIKRGRAKLLEHRKTEREPPQVDTKVIASWNGLAIASLTRAANTLATVDKHRAARCQEAAERAATYVHCAMYDPTTGRLSRIANTTDKSRPRARSKSASHASNNDDDNSSSSSGGGGGGGNTAFVDDYAYMTQAALMLYDLTLSQPYLDWAVQLQEYLDTHFADATEGSRTNGAGTNKCASANGASAATNGATKTDSSTAQISGYFQTEPSDDQIIRLKPGTDTSLPSPNGIIATNLLYLSSYMLSRQREYISKSRSTLAAFAIEIIQHPFLYVSLLSALIMEQVGVKTLIAPMAMRDSQLRRLKGWGRTVVRGFVTDVMICTKKGACRPLRQSDLEDVDDEGEGEDEKEKENKAEVKESGSQG